jgi:hypothetical protein
MVSYKPKRSFSNFLSGTAKVQTTIPSKVMVAVFEPGCFFTPISNDPNSPFFFSPYNLALQMPWNASDSRPAFHQLGKVEKHNEIHGLCIPALAEEVPDFAKRVIHFVNAKILELGAGSILDRVLTPEAALEVSHHVYNMSTHKVSPIDMDLPDFDDNNKLEGFDDVEDPLGKSPMSKWTDAVMQMHTLN